MLDSLPSPCVKSPGHVPASEGSAPLPLASATWISEASSSYLSNCEYEIARFAAVGTEELSEA
eukprot:7976861-Pyramimonas_sp.AAC.1